MADGPLNRAKKQTAFAWAKYYESVNVRLAGDTRAYRVATTTLNADGIPEHIKNEIKTMATELRKTWNCPICLDMISSDNLDITNCGHYFCKPCLTHHKENNRTNCVCPMCRKKIYVA